MSLTRADLVAAAAVSKLQDRPELSKAVFLLIEGAPTKFRDNVKLAPGLSGENWGGFTRYGEGDAPHVVYTVLRLPLVAVEKFLASGVEVA